MKSIDIKSVIIGVLGTVFVSIGAKSQDENLGDITVNSIKVVDDKGKCIINSNGISIGTTEMMIVLVCEKDGGQIHLLSKDGEAVASLGADQGGNGMLHLHNNFSKEIGYFGATTDQDGMIILSDRYGDVGWAKIGKK